MSAINTFIINHPIAGSITGVLAATLGGAGIRFLTTAHPIAAAIAAIMGLGAWYFAPRQPAAHPAALQTQPAVIQPPVVIPAAVHHTAQPLVIPTAAHATPPVIPAAVHRTAQPVIHAAAAAAHVARAGTPPPPRIDPDEERVAQLLYSLDQPTDADLDWLLGTYLENANIFIQDRDDIRYKVWPLSHHPDPEQHLATFAYDYRFVSDRTAALAFILRLREIHQRQEEVRQKEQEELRHKQLEADRKLAADLQSAEEQRQRLLEADHKMADDLQSHPGAAASAPPAHLYPTLPVRNPRPDRAVPDTHAMGAAAGAPAAPPEIGPQMVYFRNQYEHAATAASFCTSCDLAFLEAAEKLGADPFRVNPDECKRKGLQLHLETVQGVLPGMLVEYDRRFRAAAIRGNAQYMDPRPTAQSVTASQNFDAEDILTHSSLHATMQQSPEGLMNEAPDTQAAQTAAYRRVIDQMKEKALTSPHQKSCAIFIRGAQSAAMMCQHTQDGKFVFYLFDSHGVDEGPRRAQGYLAKFDGQNQAEIDRQFVGFLNEHFIYHQIDEDRVSDVDNENTFSLNFVAPK